MHKKQVGAWALFDFANSVYPAVITTTVFSIYYVGTVVGNETGQGNWWWGLCVSVSALIVAVSSPLLGAIADRGGARKKFMLAYTAVCLIGVLLMTLLRPGMVIAGLVIFVIANVGFESALVFYNAYLPDIAPREKQGWVSGLGFGVGYLGSALGLIMVLPFAVQESFEVVWVLVAAFFLVFGLPAFFYLPRDRSGGMTVPQAARWGLTNFRAIVREVWQLEDLRNFLIAFFFYIDGVLTIIVSAGNVATETFDFTFNATITLFLVVQISALIGAFALAKPTDRYGPKRILNGVLVLWIAASVSAFFIQSPTLFWLVAVVVGLGLGAVQSASRSFMSSLIPEGREAEMFGFYALCGKSSSVVGPLLFGGAALIFSGNQRPGFLLIAGLFIVGLALLQRVNDPRAAAL